MMSSRDLTIFGRAMLIKTLVYRNWSTLPLIWMFPKELRTNFKTNFLSSSGRTEKITKKRSGLYEDLGTGGIRMTNFEVMLKVLKLAWILRLIRTSDNSDRCIIPKILFQKEGRVELSTKVQLRHKLL